MHSAETSGKVLFLIIILVVIQAMPKLYFRHGAVSSAKTLNLLAVAHNYKTQGKNVILMKVYLHLLQIKFECVD